ncbi:hypothetical protein VTO73DRAFT_6484 [Trametes versicolor]
MRLLDISQFPKLKFCEVTDLNKARYAVLSHVWNKEKDEGGFIPEPTFQEVAEVVLQHYGVLPEEPKFDKLRSFCQVAHTHGYKLAWADMCCIDKTSSAEVSEAIASMFYWYRTADVCYAYLKDVPSSVQPLVSPEIVLLSSEWFRRGWTLQELIAPRSLIFLSSDWRAFGTKSSLANYIMSITHIPTAVLIHEQSVHSVSVAQRMSWAAGRHTLRPEDQAYCLMGLFGIQIPVMYGEGTYAFIRLQEEILKRIPDPTLLAWGLPCNDCTDLGLTMRSDSNSPHSPVCVTLEESASIHVQAPQSPIQVDRFLFAASPDDFARAGRGREGLSIRRAEHLPSQPLGPFPFQSVPCHMLHMRAPLIPLYPIATSPVERASKPPVAHLALLGCETHTGKALALLFSVQRSPGGTYWCIGSQSSVPMDIMVIRDPSVVRIVALDSRELCAPTSATASVYAPLSAPPSAGDSSQSTSVHRALSQNDGQFTIKLSGWCAVTLGVSQYYLFESSEPHTYLLSLPPDYETCPHMTSSSDTCPFASGAQQCPDSSAVLKITFSNCDSSTCRRPDPPNRYLWGDVKIDVPSPKTTMLPNPIVEGCRGVQHHVASWTLRDGVALKTFNFQIRKMQDISTPGSPHPQPRDTRSQSILVTLALKRMPSERSEENHEFLLEVDICKQTRPVTTASSPVRGSEIDPNFLSPTHTSPTAESGRQYSNLWPMVRTRSNSVANLSTAGPAVGHGDLQVPDIVQRRTRSASFSGDPSPTPSFPPVPILITPAPPSAPTIPAARTLAAPPSSPSPSPIAPILVARNATAPEPSLPVAGLSRLPERLAPSGLGDVAEVAVERTPQKHVADDAETTTKMPRMGGRITTAALSSIRRIISNSFGKFGKWGRRQRQEERGGQSAELRMRGPR